MVIHNSVLNKKGNIWMFWNKALPTPSVVSLSSQMITVSVGDTLISGVHAHVSVVHRRVLWSKMEAISALKKPWLVIGDFNTIISIDEKVGGRSPHRRSMLDFTECLDKCELIQAPHSGLQYSWSNGQQGTKRILCALDRAVYNQLWVQKYGNWNYKIGIRIASDHAPLLGGSNDIPKPLNCPKNFRKSGCLILDSWKCVFGDVHVKIKEAEKAVEESMSISDDSPFDVESLNTLVDAENIFNSREVKLQTLLNQKAKIDWVKDGAANTAFFHTNL
ncbi:uncharacterized protein LOC113279426 [Papaver somniferum]|uniref:uncharacterized protein LOC113279426 n=1 Tax=Papaver somniferum TaxID=3469 RepID=UPI000E702630|nr:uncharacterized protein LOC113279426 [Papaver somniferum]